MAARSWAVAYLGALGVAVQSLAAQTPTPRELLSALPSETGQTVVALEGALGPLTGIASWRVYLNDALAFEKAGAETTLSLGLILREGDNLVAIEAFDGRGTQPVARWTKHVHRAPPVGARQYAILVQGKPSDSPGPSETTDAMRGALLEYGVGKDDILTVSRWNELRSALGEISRRSRSLDQVLIYYRGSGRVSARTSEPELLVADQESLVRTWPAGLLISEASDLPATSVLLDIKYEASPSLPSAAGWYTSQATAAPWLRTLRTTDVELAYTNPFFTNRTTDADFTPDFIRTLSTFAGGDECATFAGVARSVASENSLKTNAAWPVFYTAAPSRSFRFCGPGRAAAVSKLAARSAPAVDADPQLLFLDVTSPSDRPAAQILVDGVPVVRAPAQRTPRSPSTRIPVGPGNHVITTSGSSTMGAPAITLTSGAQQDVVVTVRWTDRMIAQLERTIPAITSEATVAISFVVGDETIRPVRYEIRNNGVVVDHDVVTMPTKLPRRQIVRRIPLAAGANNLVLDVVRGAEFTAFRADTITRRTARPIRALIVGVDAPAGAPPLQAAAADAHRIRSLLLRHSDAAPGDIEILTGAEATQQRILDAFQRYVREPARSESTLPEDTFVFYFAGYGLSIEEAGQVRRCLVTADFDPTRPGVTCLGTGDVDAALATIGQSLVIVDSSYDGEAGPGSRTYRTFGRSNDMWRVTSGADKPDRVFLVASGANSAAFESEGGGLFTHALDSVVQEQLGGDQATPRVELSLQEAYERARAQTAQRSRQRQIPVMKGIISTPFSFVAKSLGDLKKEAFSIERAARNDHVSMRRLNRARLLRARALYVQAATIAPEDADALLGQARVALLLEEALLARALLSQAAAQSDAAATAEWHAIHADLTMRAGDIAGALTSAQRAVELSAGDPVHAARLGGLYIATGAYKLAVEQLQTVLAMSASKSHLSDEELGRVVLLTYVALRRDNRAVEAGKLLANFSSSLDRNRHMAVRILSLGFADKRRIESLGEVGVQTPWAHLVAQFFRDEKPSESLLSSFLTETEPYDPRDRTAFVCMLNYYIGMSRRFNERLTDARLAFRTTVDSVRPDFIEYWISKSEVEEGP